jgi:hypothetical protein
MNGDKPFEVVCLSLYAYCDSTTIRMFNLKEPLRTLTMYLSPCLHKAGKALYILNLSYDPSYFTNRLLLLDNSITVILNTCPLVHLTASAILYQHALLHDTQKHKLCLESFGSMCIKRENNRSCFTFSNQDPDKTKQEWTLLFCCHCRRRHHHSK